MSGTRNGVDWPRIGSVMELPDEEAIGYIAAGQADPVAELAREERAVKPPFEEVRTVAEVGQPEVASSEPLTEKNAGGLVPQGPVVHRRGRSR